MWSETLQIKLHPHCWSLNFEKLSLRPSVEFLSLDREPPAVLGVDEEEDELIFTLALHQQTLLHLLSLKNDKHTDQKLEDRERDGSVADTHGVGQDPVHSRPSQTKAHLKHTENTG